MNEDLIRQQTRLQQQVDGLIKPEVSTRLVAPFLDLPGKVGIWYMGDVQRSTGDVYDRSGQGRLLTYNGNPTYNQLSNGIAYIALDGTGDYLSRPDETDLDVQGNETQNAAAVRGMSAGCYVWFDNLTAIQGIICKGNAAFAASSFEIYVTTTGALTFRISTGAAYIAATSAASAVTTSTWYHILCTYDPSTRMEIWLNGVSVANQTVAVPATIPNTVRPLTVGSFDGLLPMTGRLSIAHYNANLFPDALVGGLFQQTRALFGV